MASIKVPREGLADLLERVAGHARKYVVEGLHVDFDGEQYRVSVTGQGELLQPDQSSADQG